MSRRLLLLRRWLECSPGPERRDLVARGGFAQHEEHSGALLLQRIVGRAVQHERAKHLDRRARRRAVAGRSEEHTSELQSQSNLVCRLLLEKKKKKIKKKSRHATT